ncbi:MAG: saccharopine dehydrogenase NADP-binding domain-containing protein [Ilumatobacteraceae bacterium]
MTLEPLEMLSARYQRLVATGEHLLASGRRVATITPARGVPSALMRVLVVGSGGVGSAFVAIAPHREAYDHITVADIDVDKAQAAVETAVNVEGGRIEAALVDAPSEERSPIPPRGAAPM